MKSLLCAWIDRAKPLPSSAWVGRLVTLCVMAVALPVGIATGAKISGHPTLIIKGRSMGDAVPVGGLAIGTWAEAASVSLGDVILLEPSTGAPFVHRVVDRIADPAGVRVRTRGDANATVDAGWYRLPQRTLTVAFTMPYVGYVFAALGSRRGIAAILLLFPIVALALVTRRHRGIERNREAV